jgi:hypothetical protein
VDRAGNRLTLGLAALALAGCGAVSDPTGFAIVAQDRYDFMTCTQILSLRTTHAARVKELGQSIEKAETSPGGFLVAGAAYRTEYVQARALVAAAERAARKNNCDPPKP